MSNAFTRTALAAALMTLATQQASAQLEEVVVTAQKRAQSMQDIPVAVSAFQNEQLQDFGITTTQGLQAVTPSLVYNNRGPVAQPFIRGIGTTLSLMGLEPSVATYVDDQYYARPMGSIMELPDLERIEVLKGPQGTLYGRNATGGAIRIVTRNPGHEFAGDLKLSAGNYGYWGASAYLEGGLSETLAANFSVMSKQRDGFGEQREPGMDDLDDLDVQSYRTKFVWDASDNVVAKLSLDYTEREDTAGSETIDVTSNKSILGTAPGAIGPSFAEGLGRFPPFGNVVPTGKAQDDVRSSMDKANEQSMFNMQLRFDVTGDSVDFASITTYQDFDSETNTADFDMSSLVLADVSDEETNESFSQEFQLLSATDSKLEWILGAYYFQAEGEYELLFGATDLVLTGFQSVPSPASEVDTTAWALFGQATWRFNDSWALTVGGRYSDEEKELSADTVDGLGTVEDEDDWTEFTPKAVLEYSWDDGMVYLSYARGFKSGGFAYPYITDFSDASVDSEILDMYELGLKADLSDSLRLNGAIFFYDYEDLQVNRNAGFVPGVGIVIPVENAGGAEVLGGEIDLTWAATEDFTITGGLTLLETEYTDYEATPSVYNTTAIPGAVVVPVNYDAKGDDMIRAPDVAAFVSFNYEVNLDSGAYIPITLTYSHKGEYNFDLQPGDASNRVDEYTSDSYELLNARVAYNSADDRWSVAAWGNNLTDEEYFDEVVAFATGVRATVGAPRTYGVDFTYRF